MTKYDTYMKKHDRYDPWSDIILTRSSRQP